MKKSKTLHSFYLEGVQFETRIQTSNKWKTFNIAVHTNIRRGFNGRFKGKHVIYKDYCPPGYVRHHKYYVEDNINAGIEIITREEHSKIHNNGNSGKFLTYATEETRI